MILRGKLFFLKFEFGTGLGVSSGITARLRAGGTTTRGNNATKNGRQKVPVCGRRRSRVPERVLRALKAVVATTRIMYYTGRYLSVIVIDRIVSIIFRGDGRRSCYNKILYNFFFVRVLRRHGTCLIRRYFIPVCWWPPPAPILYRIFILSSPPTTRTHTPARERIRFFPVSFSSD